MGERNSQEGLSPKPVHREESSKFTEGAFASKRNVSFFVLRHRPPRGAGSVALLAPLYACALSPSLYIPLGLSLYLFIHSLETLFMPVYSPTSQCSSVLPIFQVPDPSKASDTQDACSLCYSIPNLIATPGLVVPAAQCR